jgi:hypothetical protein
MSRATPTEVRVVISTSLSDEQIQVWLDMASLIVDNYATQCSSASEAVLKTIEILLTAHFIAIGPDQARYLKSKTIGSSSETYQFSATGGGYSASAFGQQALLLDPCGILPTLNQAPAMTWLL